MNLSAPDRSVLVAGSAVVAILLLWRSAPAVVSWRAEEITRAKAISANARAARAMIAGQEQIRFALAEREQRHLAMGAALLKGTSEAAVASEFVGTIHHAADGSGFQISSIAVRQDSGLANLRRVTADVRGRGAAEALAQFLAALEGDVPLVAVRSLSASVADIATITESGESVRVHLILEALAPGEGSTKSRGIRLRDIPPVHVYDLEALFEVADGMAERNPFRPLQAGAGETRLASTGSYLPPLPPRPEPVLQGVVGGPPWQAIVAGIPGREGGVVVVPGDTVGGMKVRSVGRESAVLVAKDTTYSLTLKVIP